MLSRFWVGEGLYVLVTPSTRRGFNRPRGDEMARTITLELDEEDWDTIQREFAKQQSNRDEDGPLLPDGTSNMAGAMIAEAIRNLDEYRSLYEDEHPR